jgi:hypothetical protein
VFYLFVNSHSLQAMLSSNMGAVSLPKPSNLVRGVGRARQKLRPQEPQTIEFDLHDYARQNLFGDLRVNGARHLLYASTKMRVLLSQAKTW